MHICTMLLDTPANEQGTDIMNAMNASHTNHTNPYPYMIRFSYDGRTSDTFVEAPNIKRTPTEEDRARLQAQIREEKERGLNLWSRIY